MGEHMKKIIFLLLSLCVINTVYAAPQQKLTVLLDWFPNPDHAPLIVANELGYSHSPNTDSAIELRWRELGRRIVVKLPTRDDDDFELACSKINRQIGRKLACR